MGALGAVGGVGGLGSIGDSGSSSDAGAESDAAAASVGSSQGWYDSSSVMSTSGVVDSQGTVTLDDADLSSQYVLGEKEPEQLQAPQLAPSSPDVPSGVGDSPSGDVINQVAAMYAANSGECELGSGW
jgi:hypothetical protein